MNGQTFSVRVLHDVRIPVRDGTRLAANLYLPETDSPVPALLEYTPYLKDGRGGRGVVETAQRYFAQRGYACLTLDMRGFGASDGIPAPPFSAQEKEDGYDVLDWMASQPWCNGRTGMWGASYGGDTSLSVASLQPPSLKAIVPIHATDDEFTGVCYPHGCRGGLWGDNDWGLMMVGLQLLPPLCPGTSRDWAHVWRERLDRMDPVPFSWHKIPPATWATWRADVAAIRAATYAVSAWHDVYPAETLRVYETLTAPKRVLIGPWKHEFPDRAVTHPIGFWQEMTRWWDHWLKDIDTGIMDEPPIVAYRQPDGGYHYEASWPPATTRLHEYYLDADGSLSPGYPAGPGTDTYRVDPTVGLAHLPWDWITPTARTPADLSSDDHRALTYTSSPLDADLEITGQPDILVYLASDQPDFPLAAWLADVAPSGFSTLICQGWVRPAHVIGTELTHNQMTEIRVPLLPTSYRLKAGHRLRLAIAGSDFPVLVPLAANPLLRVGRGGDVPSRLRLPVVPLPREDHPVVFSPAVCDTPAAVRLDQSEHAVTRDLLGRTAGYRHQQRALYQLDGGALLHTDAGGLMTVDAQSPGSISLQGTQRLTLDRGLNTVVVQTEALETYDHFHIEATITVDGRPFYHRSWDHDLSHVAWGWPALQHDQDNPSE